MSETPARPAHAPDSEGAPPADADRAGLAGGLLRLARPTQWAKQVFVLVGPVYGLIDGRSIAWAGVAWAVVAFSLAASGCYVVNDIRDRAADRLHPRKRRRPIASGRVPVGIAAWFAAALFIGALGATALVPGGLGLWTGVAVGVYIASTLAYSAGLKHAVILDVIILAAGFVLRVLGGCAAAGVEPSTWLLNVTFFVSMFLAFGKRLGERRTMEAAGIDAALARKVHAGYSIEFLRMAVVVTAVATLVTYAGYVLARDAEFTLGFNLLWLTMLPATYGLLRCIVLVERGDYDDPTELATKDPPFQIAAALFAIITLALVVAQLRGLV